MKKLILLATLLLMSGLNAQFRNAKDFIEFANFSLEKQKVSLKTNGWELVSSTEGVSKPSAAFKTTKAASYKLKSRYGIYYLSIKLGTLSGVKSKETKLVLPNEQGLILSDWIIELSNNDFNFSQINPYIMAAVGKTYTLMIKMIPSDGYSAPISEITYMSH